MIGYIGRISPDDMERIEKRGEATAYQGTHHIGKVGIEQSYEAELHGIAGHEQVEITAGGRAVRTLSRSPSTPGNNLVLSVDIELQKIAETRFRRPTRCLDRDRAEDGRRAGIRREAHVRPESVCRWHRSEELGRAEQRSRQTTAEPRVARHVSDRLDLQTISGAGRARDRQAPGRIR